MVWGLLSVAFVGENLLVFWGGKSVFLICLVELHLGEILLRDCWDCVLVSEIMEA